MHSKPVIRFLFLISFIFSLCLEAAQAHQVIKNDSPQYLFPVHDNQSELQDSDVQILFWILESHFGPQLLNPTQKWTQGYQWSNPYIGAGSVYDNQNFTVMLWGGFVRARFMNIGVLATTLCHEIGHRLGGEPYQKFPDADPHWSSAEGQADHFAATQCLPKVYDSLKKLFPEKFKSLVIEDFSLELCKNAQDKDQCRWIAQAGVDFVEFLQAYYDLKIPAAQPTQWAPEKVEKTLFTAYPTYQCRMDIFKSGAQDKKSERLSCWYKP